MSKEYLQGIMAAKGCREPIADILGYQAKMGSSPMFAAVTLESGAYAGVWEGHTDVFATINELLAALNCHERSLLKI